MSHWDFGRAPAEQRDEPIADGSGRAYDDEPYDDGPYDGEPDDDDIGPYPITWERGRLEPGQSPFGPADVPDDAHDPYEPYEIWPAAPMPDDLPESGRRTSVPGRRAVDQPRRRRPDRRVLIGAGVALAAAVAATAVLLPGARPGRAAAAAPSATGTAAGNATASVPASRSGPVTPSAAGPASTAAGTGAGTGTRAGGVPLTLAGAQAVLAGYVAADNQANARRDNQALAAIEDGSSFAIDAGRYRTALGSVPVPVPPAAYTLASATCYLPRTEPAAGPHWFVAEVGIAAVGHPKTVTSVQYLLFLRDAAGAPWRDAIEPALLPGASAPPVAVGGDGLASAVPITAASLTVAPAELPALTARALDARTATTALAVPANVPDRRDQRAWQAKAPALTITDRHAPATAGQAFALRTTSGGALVFYNVAATVTITPHPKRTFRLYVPGFYAPAQALRKAVIQYRDQFAAYDPPARSGALVIIADHNGITRGL